MQITAQATRYQHPAQEPAARQPPLICFPALPATFPAPHQPERRRVAQMAEIMEVIVYTFQLRQQHAQPPGAQRNSAVGSRLHSLAIGQSVRNAADGRNTFRENDAMKRVLSFEPLLHAAMLVEQMRLVVQNLLTDIEEGEFRRFQHVGAHRSERQHLHVRPAVPPAAAALCWRYRPASPSERISTPVPEVEPCRFRATPAARFRMITKLDAVKIHGFPLVPTHRGQIVRQAGRIGGRVRTARPQTRRSRG